MVADKVEIIFVDSSECLPELVAMDSWLACGEHRYIVKVSVVYRLQSLMIGGGLGTVALKHVDVLGDIRRFLHC